MSTLISSSDIYKGLWKCRDFEISHVWQRAVFLSAFLLACYAGYGSAVVSFCTSEDLRVPFPIANAMLFAVALVGLLLSMVWIMMAKGSKAWYEHYEAAIDAFEKNCGAEFGCVMRVKRADEENSGFECPSTSSWLWNTKGGAYSVAKINVVIGHVSTLIWLSLLMSHVFLAREEYSTWNAAKRVLCEIVNVRFLAVIACSVLLLFWFYSLTQIKSSFLKDR